MAIKFGKAPKGNTGKGFITHEDQEQDGLAFMVVTEDLDWSYLIIKGNTTEMNMWATRVGAEQMSKAEFKTVVGPLVPLQRECDMGHTHDSDDRANTLTAIDNFIL